MDFCQYKGKLVRVIDGDTYEFHLDLGFDIGIGMAGQWHFRLKGADTPEVFGRRASEAGRLASSFVKKLLWAQPSWLVVRTYKTRKGEERKTLGRYLLDIRIVADDTGALLEEPVWLAGYLIEKGFAT